MNLRDPSARRGASEAPLAVRRLDGSAVADRALAAVLAALFAALLLAAADRVSLLRLTEFGALDRMLAARVAPGRSPAYVAVVEIVEADVKASGGVLPDSTLGRLLTALLAHRPAAVGVSLYRDTVPATGPVARAITGGHVVLAEALAPGTGLAVPPPTGTGCAPVGHVNFEEDRDDGGVRRLALVQRDSTADRDETHVAMPYQLAQLALRGRGVNLAAECLGSDDIWLWQRLADRDALLERAPPGTRDEDVVGPQILLDPGYRPDRVPTLGLDRAIAGGASVDAIVRGRVVVVGSVAGSVHRPVRLAAVGQTPTPHAIALATEQLVATAQGTRTPVRPWPAVADRVWIALWIILGAVLVVAVRSVIPVIVGAAVGVPVLWLVAGHAAAGGWIIPVVAPAAGWLAAVMAATWLEARRERRLRAALMGLFSRHLSPALAAEVWTRRAEFADGGRPRPQEVPVTVLFADLRGYSTAAERTAPALLMAWVDAFTGAMASAVARHGGLVDDYAGDGIKADFGVPIARRRAEEVRADACRAAACAMAMAEALAELRAEWAARGIPPAAMRIGLHSGTAVAGTVGGTGRLKYTVVGDAVNTAARLETLDGVPHDFDAAPCRILLSAPTAHLIAEDFVTEQLGEYPLKGRAQPVEVHRLLGPRGAGRGVPGAASVRGRLRAATAVLATFLLALDAGAQGPPGVARGRGAAQATTTSPRRRRLLYVRPGVSRASVALGTRGGRDAPLCVLAPRDHDGVTREARPALAWWLAPGGAWPAQLRLALRGAGVRVDTAFAVDTPGIHQLSLATLGVTVPPDSGLLWRVSLVRGDAVWSDSAVVRRTGSTDRSPKRGAREPLVQRARRLAARGVWYDALEAISTAADDRAATTDRRRAAALRDGFLDDAGVLAPDGCP